tara:strand:- start:15550 stop:16224 length:675 start_codon:yes stop_codon:yes gene_type:complete
MVSWYRSIIYKIKILRIKIWQKLYPYCLCFILFLPTSAIAQNQKATQLGLVAELVHLNHQTTQMALMILNDSNLNAKVKLEFSQEYLSIKTISDQIILQFIADFNQNGKAKEFDKIDKLLTQKSIEEVKETDLNGKASNYLKALIQYSEYSKQLNDYQQYANIATEVAILMDNPNLVLNKASNAIDLIANKYMKAGKNKKLNENELSKLLWALQLEPIAALLNE